MKALSSAEAPDGWRDFCDLLDAVLSWRPGVAVMLAAYSDASHRPQTGTYCVAALGISDSHAKKMDREWRALFGGRVCHMTDLQGRHGDFADCSGAETARLHKAAIGLMRRYVQFSVAYSLNLADADVLPKDGPPEAALLLAGMSQPYPACIGFAMVGLAELIRPSNLNGTGLAYFVEQGDEFAGNARLHINGIPKQHRLTYQFRSLTEASKGDIRLLEAADILAWEWAKHVDRVAEGRPVRGSLQAFVGNQHKSLTGVTDIYVPTFKGLHLTRNRLARWSERQTAMLNEVAALDL